MKNLWIIFCLAVLCFGGSRVSASNGFTPTASDSLDLFMMQQWMELRNIHSPVQQAACENEWIKHKQKLGWFDWVGDVIDWFADFGRPVWGWYTEGNNLVDAPYTTFDQAYDETKINDLKTKINAPNDVYKYKQFYQLLYILGSDFTVNPCGDKTTLCDNAQRAKAAAFVYLVGYDADGNDLSVTNPQLLADCKTFSETVLLAIKTQSGRFSTIDMQQRRAEELVQYLQCFDYLQYGVRLKGTSVAQEDHIMDKLHDFTYELYSYSNNFWNFADDGGAGSLRRYNNLAMLTAGAIGMAAIVLHHHGAYIWQIQNKPERWAHAAHAYLNLSMFTVNDRAYTSGPNAERGKLSGFAEGPGYLQFTLQTLVPFFRSFNNFVRGRDMKGTYYQSALGDFTGQEIQNYLHDPDYDNLFKWYNDILQPNGLQPSIDDTRSGSTFPIAVVGKNTLASLPYEQLVFDDNVNLLPDYLGIFNHYNPKTQQEIVYFPDAGNIILREEFDRDGRQLPLSKRHSLHVLCEKGVNFNGIKPFDQGHEHADATSFIITAGEDILAMDPGYYGFPNRGNINKGDHHNVITAETLVDLEWGFHGPVYTTSTEVIEEPVEKNGRKTFTVGASYYSLNVERTFSMYADNVVYPFYTIADKVSTHHGSTGRSIRFNLNGNGASGTCRSLNNHTVIFDHPCHKEQDGDSSDNWKLRVTTSVQSLTGSQSAFQSGSTHQTFITPFLDGPALKANNGHITTITGGSGKDLYGEHYRVVTEHQVSSSKPFMFYTTIEPLPCTVHDTVEMWGVQESEKSTAHSKRHSNNGVDPNREVRYIRVDENSMDTLFNPFNFSGSTAQLETDAMRMDMTYAENNTFAYGTCESFTYFRKAEIEEGTLLKYDDTTYISSSSVADVSYSIRSIYSYTGFCKTQMPAVVEFYLPDLVQGVEMVAIGNGIDRFAYDTVTFMMRVYFQGNVFSRFTFQVADPCKLSCFYPDSNTHVVGTFTHRRSQEILGHKLKILPDSGRLNLYNGAQMNICTGKYLHNADSLILLSPDHRDPVITDSFVSRCKEVESMYQVLSAGSKENLSGIFVNSGAALVLAANSYTHVGANSFIFVRRGGTLIIEDSARVDIGTFGYSGRGAIIAEDDANVCLAPGASVSFVADSTDTIDKNIFYVFLRDLLVPVDGSVPRIIWPTSPTVGNDIYQVLFDDTLIGEAGVACQPFCSYPSVFPEHGIGNRKWGYAPFATPFATFQVNNDTICPGDCIYVDFAKVLNESDYQIEICRVTDLCDTIPFTGCLQTGFDDIYLRDESPVISDICRDIKKVPERISYCVKDTGWHRVYVKVWNECGESDDTMQFVYVPPAPAIVIDIPDSICPGYGTLFADGSQTNSYTIHKTYRWSIVLVVPDSIRARGIGIDYGGDWGPYDSLQIDSAFHFPDFRFVGGFQYAVGLSVKGWCGWETRWDTVNVPLGVHVSVSKVYNMPGNPTGPTAIKLTGRTTGAASWHWSPATDLSDPYILEPISTTPVPIDYILTVSDGGVCTNSDTVSVVNNTLLFGGFNRKTCSTDKTVIGTGYNIVALLGVMYAMDSALFWNVYEGNLLSSTKFPEDLIELGRRADMLDLLSSQTGTLQTLISDPYILENIVKTREFATFYEDFLLDPANASNYMTFSDFLRNEPSINQLIDFNGGWDEEFDSFIADFSTLYDQCNEYESYPSFGKKSSMLHGLMYITGAYPGSTPPLFPAFFDSYLNSSECATFMATIPSSYLHAIYSDLMSGSSTLEAFFEDPDFTVYHDSLLASLGEQYAFPLLYEKLFTDNAFLNAVLAIEFGTTWSPQDMDDLFDDYMTWLVNTKNCLNFVETIWEEEQEDHSWVELPEHRNQHHILVNPQSSRKYKATLIDHENNIVEYDLISVAVDTPVVPYFYPVYQVDSTVYFQNLSITVTPATTYLWAFGDGDSSTLMHPFHTFPMFDTSYVVCMTATNSCGSFTHCDTIRVDSSGFYGFGKSNGRKPSIVEAVSFPDNVQPKEQSTDKLHTSYKLSVNRPNPFSESSVIEYGLNGTYHQAELVIYNPIGQQMKKLKLNRSHGTVTIDGSAWPRGLYFYSLIVDGTVVNSKAMLVEH